MKILVWLKLKTDVRKHVEIILVRSLGIISGEIIGPLKQADSLRLEFIDKGEFCKNLIKECQYLYSKELKENYLPP